MYIFQNITEQHREKKIDPPPHKKSRSYLQKTQSTEIILNLPQKLCAPENNF